MAESFATFRATVRIFISMEETVSLICSDVDKRLGSKDPNLLTTNSFKYYFGAR